MSEIRQQIEELINNHRVVLFMKGTRNFPQCGFSARSVEVFKRCGVAVKDVNILADPAMRQGIKDYSSWPTIPQAYVDGKFVGGSDILLEMFESGELHKLLGVEPSAGLAGGAQAGSDSASARRPDGHRRAVRACALTVTQTAAAAFAAAAKDADEGDVLRFEVSPSFQYDLFFGPKQDDDFAVACGDLTVHVSRGAVERANGTRIDFVDGPGGTGFKIDNPNEQARVGTITANELKARMAAGEALVLFDVRGDKERQIAKIDAARILDDAALASLGKDAFIVLYCHHGVRSRTAAERLAQDGFRNVFSLTGGIDAWSAEIDPSVPRY